MSGSAVKPPINRKVAIYILAMLGGLCMLAVLIAVTKNNPQQQRAAAKAAAEQAAVKALPAGTEQEGKEAITRRQDAFDSSKIFSSPLDGTSNANSNGAAGSAAAAKPGEGAMPPVDETTLAQLDQAFQAASKPGSGDSHATHGGDGSMSSEVIGSSLANNTSADKTPGVYEAYPGQKQGGVMNASQATGMEPTSDTPAKPGQKPGTYTAVKPLAAPDGMLMLKGTMIRLVLDKMIDTRNAGDISATVTQDVYDSLRQSQLLVPKGSRLLGTYATKVSPGLPRIPVTFTRLQLPDGRVVDMGKANAVNYAGATGIDGKYHSNILRALGPSLVVALIGTGVDNLSKSRNTTTAGPGGTTMQSPSVAEQMAPQVNSEVLSRYSSAQPYFIVKAGTQFKVVTQSDVVIPGGATPRYPTYGETNADAQAAQSPSETAPSGVWEAGVSAQ